MRRVNAIWAAEHEAAEAGAHDQGPSFRDRLAEAGFAPSDVEGIEEVLEAEARARAIGMAAGFVRELRERLKTESAAGAALAKVLGDETAGADLAATLGVSKQAVGGVATRLKAVFSDVAPGAKRARLRRPDLPGAWMTCAEIRVAVGVSVDRLRRLGLHPLRCGSRHFWNEADVRRRLEQLELEAAARRAGPLTMNGTVNGNETVHDRRGRPAAGCHTVAGLRAKESRRPGARG